MTDATVSVGVQADPADLAKIEADLAASIKGGSARGAKESASTLKAALGPQVAALGDAIAKGLSGSNSAFDKAGTAARGFSKELSTVSQDSLNIVHQFQQAAAGMTATANAIARETATMVRASIEGNSSATRATNEQLIAMRNAGKLAAIEAQTQGQVQVREARTSGQQRVQITRTVLETIGRLERGLGTTLGGIARTSVGAVSKVFDTLTSVVRRNDREVFSSSTFSSALKERESVLRSSFHRQEATVRESVTRQERQLTLLREQANSGLLGAANRSGLLGGLAVGFAALSAAKSTFTVGADFTRGLAVLQASLNLTDTEMKKVRQTSIDLGNDITLPGVSALDAAQAIQTLTKQFGALGPAATGAAIAAAKGTLQLARASGASADDAAALIGSAVNVFGVSADDAVAAADKITGALTRAAGVGFTDFKDSFVQGATVFKQFIGPAESANDTLLDFNTTLAILAKNGITGSNAGAGLKQFFLQATQDTKGATNATRELAQRAGVTGGIFFDASGKARQFSDSIEILRKGVVGLSDEARKNLLGDLFGSRSITIANALINSTGESFAALREQIAKQGLAAKIAAAQNTGLKGALDALGSVVETVQILVFEKVNKALGNAVLAITNFANSILFGAGPALHTLRVGLLGVVAGVGALVALKGGIEVIQLLGRTATLAFTPFGALAVTFAALGAGVALFADRTGGLGRIFGAIRDTAQGLGGELNDRIQPVLQRVSSFITSTAIPTLERWGQTAIRDVKGAFEATVRFIQDTVIPGVQRFVGVLRSEVFPRVASIAETVGNALVTAKNTVVQVATDIGRVVGPLVAPAVDGFARLGRALGDIATGNFSTIGSGLASAGKGIGAAFANIGVAVLPSLKTLGTTVLNFLKDVFSGDHLIAAVGGIGDFLNFLGEKIGAIATNPKVIAAIGIVAGVAAKLAFDLVSGVVEGIASNIPQLLRDAWELAVKFAFNPEVLLGGVLAALVGVNLVAPIVRAFRSMGSEASTGFAAGFKSKLAGGRDFFASFLGGPGNAQDFAQERFFRGFGKEVQDAQNKLRILGSTTLVDPSKMGLDAANREIADLSRGLTDAQLKGLAFRDKLSSSLRAVGETFRGGGGVLQGLAQIPVAFGRAGADAVKAFGDKVSFVGSNAIAGFFGGEPAITERGAAVGRTFGTSLRTGLSNAKNSIVGGFNTIVDGLKTAAAEQSTTVGKLLGAGIVKAVSAAVAGIAFGQMIGSAQSGTDQLLGFGGLIASAAALGPIAGGATLAIGGITAAFTENDRQAKAAKARIKSYADELLGHLKDGQITATKNQLDFNSALEGNADLGALITKNLGTDVVAQLTKIGITLPDVIKAFQGGDRSLASFTERVREAQLRSGANWGGTILTGEKIKQTYSEVGDAIKQANEQLKFNPPVVAAAADVSKALVHNMSAIPPVLDDATAAAKAFGQAVVDANITGALGTNTAFSATGRSLADINAQVDKVSSNLRKGIIPPGTQSNVAPAEAVEQTLQNIVTVKQNIDELFASGVLPPGVTAFTDALNTGLIAAQGIGKSLDEIAKGAGKGEITLPVAGAQTEQALKGFSKTISDALKSGLDEGDIMSPDEARKKLQPLLDEAQHGAGPEAAQKLQEVFDNVLLTFAPTVDDALTASQAQAAAELVQQILTGTPFTVDPTVEIPTIGAEWAGETNALLAGLNAQVPTTFARPKNFTDSGDALDGSSILRDQLGAPEIELPTAVSQPTIPADFAADAITASKTGGQSAGLAMDAGMVIGLNSGSANVRAKAARVASDAVAAAKAELGIASPSRAFREIGIFAAAGLAQGITAGATAVAVAVRQAASDAVATGQEAIVHAPVAPALKGGAGVFAKIGAAIAEGLAGGINDGTDGVVSAVTDLVDKAVDAATGAINSVSKALRNGSSDLFSALFGSDSTVGRASFGGLQGQITESFNSLAGAIDSSFDRAADVLKRSATEKLSRADLDILGEAATSLNPNDVLGAANRGALVGSIDQIVDLGKSLIEQGVPAAQVTETMRGYLDHLRALATQYGLSGTEVDDLIGKMGLGSDALAGFVTAAEGMATALGTVTGDALKFNDTVVGLFQGVTDPNAFRSIRGVGLAEDARAAVTAALSGIAAAADANDQRAKSILDTINEGKALSFQDQLAFNQGLNGRQINFTDQFGIANRSAFEGAIKSIGDMGTALLKGGSSADYVTDQIRQQVDALANYGVSLGFNRDQIIDLVNKMGLGDDSLAQFIQSVQDAGKVADQASAAISQNNDAAVPHNGDLPPISNNPTGSDQPVRDVIVNQYLPYADPAAISLAAANGVASAVRLPV